MTSQEYRVLLRDLGPVGAEYLWWNSAQCLPYAMLAELYDYLTGG